MSKFGKELIGCGEQSFIYKKYQRVIEREAKARKTLEFLMKEVEQVKAELARLSQARTKIEVRTTKEGGSEWECIEVPSIKIRSFGTQKTKLRFFEVK